MASSSPQGRRLLTRPDPAFLVPLSVFLLVVRAPGGIFLLGVVGVVLLLWRGVTRRSDPLLVFAYAVCALTSGSAALLTGDHNPTNYVWPAVCFGVFAAALLWTGDPARNVAGLTKGLLTGFTASLGLAWIEIVTGLRLLRVGQEDNKGLQQTLSDGRFRTGAIYTNYNDLSIALTILTILVIGAMLFSPRVTRGTRVLRVTVAAGASALVVLMGSRGALGALVLGVGALVLLSARAAHPQFWTNRRLGALLVAAGAALAYAWQSPYVQDHSTASRERIIDSATHMLDLQPLSWLIGYSSDARFLHDAAALYPGELMNPHNIILELTIAYGIPGVLAAGAVWVLLIGCGAARAQPGHWAIPAYTAAVLVVPVMGAVPSTTLPYGFPQLLTLGLAVSLAVRNWPWDLAEPTAVRLWRANDQSAPSAHSRPVSESVGGPADPARP